MKNLLLLSIAIISGIVITSCTSKKQEAQTAKSLVLYYSQTGTTKAVAEEIQRQTGADIEAFDAETPYDGSYMETIGRAQQESATGTVPALKALTSNIADYDVIYLGYPIWFGTYAPPVASLLKTETFEGKTIVPFCTFGSGGLEVSVNDLKNALPKAEIKEGYGVRAARVAAIPQEVTRFLIEGGWVEGEIDALPDYSEQVPVTEAETALFDAACGDYQFPLGTPSTFGKRETATSTDYKFVVKSVGMTGEETQTVILVTVGKEEGAKPEFTRVVR